MNTMPLRAPPALACNFFGLYHKIPRAKPGELNASYVRHGEGQLHLLTKLGCFLFVQRRLHLKDKSIIVENTSHAKWASLLRLYDAQKALLSDSPVRRYDEAADAVICTSDRARTACIAPDYCIKP